MKPSVKRQISHFVKESCVPARDDCQDARCFMVARAGCGQAWYPQAGSHRPHPASSYGYLHSGVQYVHVYMCVCVCVCARVYMCVSGGQWGPRWEHVVLSFTPVFCLLHDSANRTHSHTQSDGYFSHSPFLISPSLSLFLSEQQFHKSQVQLSDPTNTVLTAKKMCCVYT